MSKITTITSLTHLASVIQSNTIVVADFWAPWCGPCRAIAPLYEQLSSQLSRPNKIAFTKVNTDEQQQVAQSYGITAMPTFLIFKNGRETTRVTGADPQKLSEAVKKLAAEAESAGSGESSRSGGGGFWRGMAPPKGYEDVTDQVDIKDLDMLNLDASFGGVRTLFEPAIPSALDAKATGKKDWVESDTDEQLMLYVPFQATLKAHTLQLTSLPPADGDDETPMRPKKIQLYINRAHNLGFEEAENLQPTQVVELQANDWDEKTGTAKIELRFVKFQNVTSLVLFIVSGDGDSEKVRLDRIRIVGTTGEKRTMGKLEKIGDESGE